MFPLEAAMNLTYISSMEPLIPAIVGAILSASGLVVLTRAYRPTKQPQVPNPPPQIHSSASALIAAEEPVALIRGEDEHESENYRKGRDFEQYVLQRFVRKKNYFRIINQRHDRLGPSGKPLPDNSNPDLEIEAVWEANRQTFAVECKFRSNWLSNRTLDWCKDHNLSNYKKFSSDRRMPVFVVLGVGGVPSAPLEVLVFKVLSSTTTVVKQGELHNMPRPKYPGFFYNFKLQQLQYLEASA